MSLLEEKLLQSGLVSQQEVEQAKEVQRKSGLRLMEYLMHQGVLGEGALMDFISTQLKIEKYDPAAYPPNTDLKELIPEDMARRLQAVAIKKSERMLWVATADPMNITRLDEIARHSNLEVEPVYCQKQEITELLASYYGAKTDIGDILGTIEELNVETKSEEDGEEIITSAIQDKANEGPVIRLVNLILAQAVRERASDIHLSPKKSSVQLRFRIDGELREFPAPPKAVFMPVISRLKLISNMDISVTRVPQDGRFSFVVDGREVNVRVSCLPTIYGENMVLRLLHRSQKVFTLDDLGMNKRDQAKVVSGIGKPYGMILATGPTGSGKTTLLYAVLQMLDKPDVNIITLEDPVEYRIETIRQVQLNRKAGMNFADGLRSILRQDPDIVMVGEIRDGETAGIAVQASMTGHLVLSTVHTNDAAGAITRFIEMGIEPFLVASTLIVAVGQRLVRRVCPHCTEPYEPAKELVAALGLDKVPDVEFKRGAGCKKCNGSGFSGRVGIYEVLFVDDFIQDLIMQRASSREIARAAIKAKKLATMRVDVAQKVMQGVTTVEEAAATVFV